MALAILGVLTGGGLVAVPWILDQVREGKSKPPGEEHVSDLFNYSFIMPAKPWKLEDSLKAPLQANLFVLRRTDPNAWMALAAKDYATRSPRKGEVIDEARRRLEGYFKNFEWEETDDATLGGQPAQQLIFRGEVNVVAMSGECLVLTYKGITYWFTTWAPVESAEVTAGDRADLHRRFALLPGREGWTEKRPPVQTFRGTDGAYQLRDTEGVWEKWPQPQDEDPAADLALHGKDRLDPKDVDKAARAVVLILTKQPDLQAAAAAARAHLEEQQKKDYPSSTFEVLTDKEGPLDRPGPVGDARGHVVKLKVTNGENRRRFVTLAVVRRPDGVLAVQCECDLKRRSLWEREFGQLLHTFTVQGK
jgi:hypothetical protein